ncbi:MAG: hypothetical protein GY705_02990, partial [Bacteroidetes bacterium]|nr:hypothetical protein [Bacteroidota bacterium]
MKKVLLILLVLATPISLLTGQQTLTETVGNPPETISITVWEDDDKFDLDFLTYSGTGDVRNTSSSNYAGASGLGNVFLDDAGYETLTISGITPNASCTSIDLSFGIRKDATALTGDDIVIEISTNGSDFSSAGTITLLTGGGTTGWYEKELTGLSGDIVSIRFTNNSLASGNNGNFRLDDIEIKGNGAGCTLPISLTTFTGHTHENTILLDWRTETEQNND